MALQDPRLEIMVNDEPVSFMVDTGARYSSIRSQPTGTYVTNNTISLTGFEGNATNLPFLSPATVQIASQTASHCFILAPQCPINLLGRDLLITLCPLIKCSADGLLLTFPDGASFHCSAYTDSMFPLMEASQIPDPVRPVADIYWALVDTCSPSWLQCGEVFSSWLPWIRSLRPYHPPLDPLHCTLFYDRHEDLVYREAFTHITGQRWCLDTQCMYIGPPGVSLSVQLTHDQMLWYHMAHPTDPGVLPCRPHISLMIAPDHTAKDLGPFTKRCIEATDWRPTTIPSLSYSHTLDSYKVTCAPAQVPSTLEHSLLNRPHGRETMDADGSSTLLDSLPASLWSVSPTDVGMCNVSPVTFSVSGDPVYVSQYPMSPAGEEGIADTIEGLLAAGVIIPLTCPSPWNTPILPVEKKGTGKYRMVHDLRKVNASVSTSLLPVPNPFAALSSLTPQHTHFTCVDLANAFFCLPLHPDVAPIFAFTWRGKRYTYSRLPQGFVLSPGIFNNTLRSLLSTLTLPDGVLLIQYVDDILLAAPSESACLSATESLLTHLHAVGLKCSRSKLQCARAQVSFLGRVVSSSGLGLSSAHRSAILSHPQPQTVKQLLSFLGLANYSRNHIPDFTDLTAPLRVMITEAGMRNLSAPLSWSIEREQCFTLLKQGLSSASDLCIPDYSLPFHLDVSVKAKTAAAVLYQKKGELRNVCLYVSTGLEPYEQRHPTCATFASALARLVRKTSHIVLKHTLHIHTHHDVAHYVTSAQFTMTAGRQRRIESELIQPHILFATTTVNMADLSSDGDQGTPHDCVDTARKQMTLRPHLYSEPLQEVDRILFTDGCCFKGEDGLTSSYAVVEKQLDTHNTYRTIETAQIEGKQSAQRAELVAVTRALTLSTDQSVNIYTDSAYVCTVVHTALGEWLRTDFLTATGQPVRHLEDVQKLHAALLLPSKVAIIKCRGHSKQQDDVSKGNDAADAAAKQTAGYIPTETGQMIQTVTDELFPHDTPNILGWQREAAPEELSAWWAHGAAKTDKGVWVKDDRPLIPQARLNTLIDEAHTHPFHVSLFYLL